MPNINLLRKAEVSTFELIDLPSLDSIPPRTRSKTTEMLRSTGFSIVNRMYGLHEGGLKVDPEVIHDIEPKILDWSTNYHVLDTPVFKMTFQTLGGKKKGRGQVGFYFPQENLVIIENPTDKWDSLSKRKQNEIRLMLQVEDLDEAKSLYSENLLKVATLEEFIHRFGNEDLIDKQLIAEDPKHSIDYRVIRFLNEAMTKTFVEEYGFKNNQEILNIFYDVRMANFFKEWSPRNLFEIVYFGSNDSNLTFNILNAIQNILLKQYQGLRIDQILNDRGYLVA